MLFITSVTHMLAKVKRSAASAWQQRQMPAASWLDWLPARFYRSVTPRPRTGRPEDGNSRRRPDKVPGRLQSEVENVRQPIAS